MEPRGNTKYAEVVNTRKVLGEHKDLCSWVVPVCVLNTRKFIVEIADARTKSRPISFSTTSACLVARTNKRKLTILVENTPYVERLSSAVKIKAPVAKMGNKVLPVQVTCGCDSRFLHLMLII